MRKPIQNWQGRILAWVDSDAKGNKTLFDFYGRILGKYDVQFDTTRDFYGRLIGKGDMLMTLVPTDSK